jgi:hypothetical protein
MGKLYRYYDVQCARKRRQIRILTAQIKRAEKALQAIEVINV